MGDDLAGMGVGHLAYDENNDIMMKQPTSIQRDHAMMDAQNNNALAQ